MSQPRTLPIDRKRQQALLAVNCSAAEIESVAQAIWDAKEEYDDSPPWAELDQHADAELKEGVRVMAIAAIAKYQALRQNDQAEQPATRDL